MPGSRFVRKIRERLESSIRRKHTEASHPSHCAAHETPSIFTTVHALHICSAFSSLLLVKGQRPEPIQATRSHSLLGDSNDAASWTAASVARLLRFGVTTFAQIVSASMDNHSTLHVCVSKYHHKLSKNREPCPNDAFSSDQLDELVRDRALCVAAGVCLEVTQITNMALFISGGAMVLVVGVD
jgi:hypothetical protein